ncbi:MAG: DNA-3-methyladenine glycosylase 2 family protein, partial [Chloroflexota bacterium]|nr:DNA-3-methyladenine glycosylase 2 family protein [Chloroflexota bacterium]
AHGRGDPTIRFAGDGIWRATRTPAGPATLRLRAERGGVAVAALGPGAAAAVEGAAELVGANDDPGGLVPQHRLIAELVRRFPGLRLPRTNRPFEALLPAICEQKVTGVEARAAFRGIIATHGEPAPGLGGLRLAPASATLAALPYFAFHRFGLERRRADLIRVAAQLAPRLETAEPAEAYARMAAVPGIGPWTLAEVGRIAFGDPDALSVGDYHLPNLVAWALAREPRADDARMLELLEPYRGQRGRVQRLLEVSGIAPPRYGPRLAPQRIADI